MKKSLIQRIGLFYNENSQFDVLGQFTEALHQALIDINIRSTIIDTRKWTVQNYCSYYEKERPDYTVGFNVTIQPGTYVGPNQIPHAALIVDGPTHFINTLINKHQVYSFVDQTYLDFMQNIGHPRGLWLPHGVEKEIVGEESKEKLYDQKRVYEVVFCGSFIDHEEILAKWKKDFSSKTVKLLDDYIEDILTNSQKNFLPECLLLLQNNSMIKEELEKKQINIFELLNDCDLYLRGKDRVQMVSQIKEANVHFFCSEKDLALWKQRNKNAKNWHFHSDVTFSNLSLVLSQSRIVLNSMPQSRRGFHERLFRAVAYGASCIAGYNSLCRDTFEQKRGVITSCGYPWHNIDETIAYLLDDEKSRLDCVFKERKLIQKEHTWDVRAKKLIEYLSNSCS